MRAGADAADAGACLRMASRSSVAALAPIEMPYMNGYEFATASKRDPQTQHIPIVFLTTEETIEENAAKLELSRWT